jgi:hypothetical protein
MKLPSSESEMVQYVQARLPEAQVGTLRTHHRIIWHSETYIILTEPFFCVHSKKTMHGPFEYANPPQVEEGLRIFCRAIQHYELASDVRRKITGPGTNAHMYKYLMIAAFVLVAFIAGLERLLPYDVPATAAPVVRPVPPKPPANCLPSGTGGPCLQFEKIQEMMNAQPDAPEVIPTNPATADEVKI